MEAAAAELGQELWDWGIPTAASIAANEDLGLEIIATGGVRSGTDVAAALSLGARAAGFAAPMLRAHSQGGIEGASKYLKGIIASLRALVFLSGCTSVTQLCRCPKVISPLLERWIAATRRPAPEGR
jgi:isopentenyl-diphosphate delta-isomerase